MTAKDLILNIAINMGRLSRFAADGRKARLNQFLKETQSYIEELKMTPKNPKIEPTLQRFESMFNKLKIGVPETADNIWAEDALTWSNILTHRAKLAD